MAGSRRRLRIRPVALFAGNRPHFLFRISGPEIRRVPEANGSHPTVVRRTPPLSSSSSPLFLYTHRDASSSCIPSHLVFSGLGRERKRRGWMDKRGATVIPPLLIERRRGDALVFYTGKRITMPLVVLEREKEREEETQWAHACPIGHCDLHTVISFVFVSQLSDRPHYSPA